MTYSKYALYAWLVAIGLVVCQQANAQHAGFVLLGDPNPEAAEVTQDQQAVHPVTAPYFQEDSFVTTDVRGWFVHHSIPDSSLLGGGEAQVYAVQVRLALTDQVQLVAYKDGYININTGLIDEDGMNDLAAGLKWNFLQDWENQLHAAAGFGYEIKAGNSKVLQNDDEVRLWLSANKGFDAHHLGLSANFRLPVDDEDPLGDSTNFSWHMHYDYYVCEWFSPVLELSGYHVIDEGDNVVVPFQGIDVFNLGGGKSEDVVTIGLGAEFRPMQDLGLRAAYETPISDNDDIFGYRWTFSAVYSF